MKVAQKTENKIYKLKAKNAKTFYKSLTKTAAREVTQLISVNKKLLQTAENKPFKAAGISFYPAIDKSCSHFKSCLYTCIAFTGHQTFAGNSNALLSDIDKNQLKRLWLFKNDYDYFLRRAKNELDRFSEFGEIQVYLRETNSETIDMRILKAENIFTYNYLKNPEKIIKPVSDFQIYSWNETSDKSILKACCRENIPVAVVVPKKLHSEILTLSNKRVFFHNGDNSDLESYDNFKKGVLNIHLLSEKRARFAKEIGRTNFLESYKNLLELIKGIK